MRMESRFTYFVEIDHRRCRYLRFIGHGKAGLDLVAEDHGGQVIRSHAPARCGSCTVWIYSGCAPR
jgi:hypothetical protein